MVPAGNLIKYFVTTAYNLHTQISHAHIIYVPAIARGQQTQRFGSSQAGSGGVTS